MIIHTTTINLLLSHMEKIPSKQDRQQQGCGCCAYTDVFTACLGWRVSFPCASLVYCGALGIFLLLSVSGCVKQGTTNKDTYEPAKPTQTKLAYKFNGAIYQEGMVIGLYEDTTARHVGDILTIKLTERASAVAHSNTRVEKEQKVDLPPPKIAGDKVTKDDKEILNNEVNAGRDFKGSGASDQAHSFDGNITVTVAEVLPNKHLVVRGEKLIVLNQADEYIRFSGIVRPQDIDQANTVESTKIGNVRLSYAGQGVLGSANSMGTLARFFQSPAFPY